MADNDKITFDYEWDWKIKKEAEKNKISTVFMRKGQC